MFPLFAIVFHSSWSFVDIFPIFTMQEVERRFPDGLPLLDPVEDMGIKDERLKHLVQKVEAFERRMYAHPLHGDPARNEKLQLCQRKAQV